MFTKVETETKVLAVILALGGEACLDDIVTSFSRFPGLTADDFGRNASLEPRWINDVRRAHQSLKDQDCLIGLEQGIWRLTPDGLRRVQADPEWNSSRRVLREITIPTRDSVQSAALKRLYEYRCQVCGSRINGGPGVWIAEAHHLRPVGRSHQGPDICENMLVLCPNHHAQFDRGVLAIEPETGMVETYQQKAPPKALALERHKLGGEFIVYHWVNLFLR